MKKVKNLSIIILAFIALSCCDSNSEKASEENLTVITESAPTELSLYDRLGGADGISAIVDDIVDSHLNNPIVSDYFSPLLENPEQMEMAKSHLREFLGAGTGGSEQYTGGDIPSVHSSMKISDREFLAVVDDILAVLTKHNIDEQSKKDMLYILYSFKGQIIEA